MALVGLQSCDTREYQGTVDFFEKDDTNYEAYRDACWSGETEFSSDELWQLVNDNYGRLAYGGECDVYLNSEGQVIARCNGENCVVKRLREPFVARVKDVGTVHMYYQAGPYFLVSCPAMKSIDRYMIRKQKK